MRQTQLPLTTWSPSGVQLPQVHSLPGAGLVQVLVSCPHHAPVGHRSGRSMSVSPWNAASDHQFCGAASHLQSGSFDLGARAEEVPYPVCNRESLAASHRVVDLAQIDATDDDGNWPAQQIPHGLQECRLPVRVAHDRPCVEDDRRTIRFQESGSSSPGKKYDDPSSRNIRISTIPARPRSTRVLGCISLKAARSSRYADVMLLSEPMRSSQNFWNSAIAASFSSRGRRWGGTGSSPSVFLFSTSTGAVSSTHSTLQGFHAIATPYISEVGPEAA